VIKWALIESFAVHARALHHFLWPTGKIDDDDVLARDYFGGTWPSAPILRSSLATADLRRDVAKYIAHVTYSRPDPGGEKDWDCPAIARELVRCMDSFQHAVAPALLDDRWRDDPLPRAPDKEFEPIDGSTTEGYIAISGVNAGSTYMATPAGSTTAPLIRRAYWPDEKD
jgi:hypothetical protein